MKTVLTAGMQDTGEGVTQGAQQSQQSAKTQSKASLDRDPSPTFQTLGR